jgi:PIN domain nuclease of toxin-antitoxin system
VHYLLDTHALLWALGEPDRLGADARSALLDPSSRVVVSAVSGWEISTKHRLGKLPQADVLLAGYVRHVRRLEADELAVTAEHALLAGSLDWPHRDPFDRMLAAQCMVESLTLLTNDAAFTALTGVRTLW